MMRLIAAMLLVCLICLPLLAVDNIGDTWNGISRTSTYINFYGEPPVGANETWPMVVLVPFYQTSIWDADSVASESTGTWNIARWLGHTGVMQWSVADTAVVPGLRTLLYLVEVQMRNTGLEDWYTVKKDTITDTLNTQFRDTLNFTDPMMRSPFMRTKVTGLEGNLKAKAATLTMSVQFERTGIAPAPTATATATATAAP